MKNTLKLAGEPFGYNGFSIREGFLVLIDEEGAIVAVSSGMNNGRQFKVYRQNESGKWSSDWEDVEDGFPVSEAFDALELYAETEDYKSACELSEKTDNLYVGDSFSVTDVIAGRKSSNGGDYGFWSSYSKTDTPGVFRVETHTTCDFDSCGTGYEGFEVLTLKKATDLKRQSEK